MSDRILSNKPFNRLRWNVFREFQ